jgi:hypothetical protein
MVAVLHGKAILLLPKYEAPYHTPACSIGNWLATSFVNSDTEVSGVSLDQAAPVPIGIGCPQGGPGIIDLFEDEALTI